MFLDLMLKVYVQTQTFLQRKDGASGIEYAIIVALVALVIVAAGSGLGDKVASVFNTMASKMTTAS